LPLVVVGNSSTNQIRRGYLYGAVSVRTKLLQLCGEIRPPDIPVTQDDGGRHDLPAGVVRNAEHAALAHRRMAGERRLDLGRPDPVPGTDDHVVGSRDEVQPPVLVFSDEVTGMPHTFRYGAAVVAEEERRHAAWVDEQLTVDDLGPDPGQRPAHRPGRRVLARPDADQMTRLRLPVPVGDRQPGLRAPRLVDGHAQRLTGSDGPAQRRQPPDRPGGRNQPVLGRCHAEDVHGLGANRLEAVCRVEPLVLRQRDRAAQPGRDERVARRLRPSRCRGRPGQLARLRCHPLGGLQPLPEHVALAMRNELRLTARAGGEQDECWIEFGQLGERRSRPAGEQRRVRHGQHRTGRMGRIERSPIALVADDQRRCGAA
jgi:hypothetical protein